MTDLTPLALDVGETWVVELIQTVDSYTHLDGDTVADIQTHGVMIDYSGKRYFVPWSNIRAIKHTL